MRGARVATGGRDGGTVMALLDVGASGAVKVVVDDVAVVADDCENPGVRPSLPHAARSASTNNAVRRTPFL